jgi:hypothetical protein
MKDNHPFNVSWMDIKVVWVMLVTLSMLTFIKTWKITLKRQIGCNFLILAAFISWVVIWSCQSWGGQGKVPLPKTTEHVHQVLLRPPLIHMVENRRNRNYKGLEYPVRLNSPCVHDFFHKDSAMPFSCDRNYTINFLQDQIKLTGKKKNPQGPSL